MIETLSDAFNSATAVKPWKHVRRGASVVDSAAFNSATAVKPWKLPGAEKMTRTELYLQFGHGSEAVETATYFAPIPQHSGLQFGHGSEAVETRDEIWLGETFFRSLQFGHGSEAVETRAWKLAEHTDLHPSIRPRQ